MFWVGRERAFIFQGVVVPSRHVGARTPRNRLPNATRAGVRFILGMEPKPRNKSTPHFVGDVVVVHELQRRAELNGQTGTPLSFDASKGRWTVQLAAEIISIKPGPHP